MRRFSTEGDKEETSEIEVQLRQLERKPGEQVKLILGNWPCKTSDTAPVFPNSREKPSIVASHFHGPQRWYFGKRDELIVLGEEKEMPTYQMLSVRVKVYDKDLKKQWTVLETKTSLSPDKDRRRDNVLLDPEGRVQFRLIQRRGPWYLVAIRVALIPGSMEPVLIVGDREEAPEKKQPFRKRRASIAVGEAHAEVKPVVEEDTGEKLVGKHVAPFVGMRVTLSSKAPRKMLEDSEEGPGIIETVSEGNASKGSVNGDFCRVRWDITKFRQVYSTGFNEEYHLTHVDLPHKEHAAAKEQQSSLFTPLADQYEQRKIEVTEERDKRLQDRMAGDDGRMGMGTVDEVKKKLVEESKGDYIKNGKEDNGKGISKADRLKACFAIPLIEPMYPPIPTPALIGPNPDPLVHAGVPLLGGVPVPFKVGTVSVAIVGAGVAATALTKRLSCLDYNVTVFEQHAVQGGRVGMEKCFGKMSGTGAPLFYPHSPAFRAEVAEWAQKGLCTARSLHVGVIPGPCRGEVYHLDSVTADFFPQTHETPEDEAPDIPFRVADALHCPPVPPHSNIRNVSDGLEGDSTSLRILYSRVWYNRGSIVKILQEKRALIATHIKDVSDLLIMLNTQVETLETKRTDEQGPRWKGDTVKAKPRDKKTRREIQEEKDRARREQEKQMQEGAKDRLDDEPGRPGGGSEEEEAAGAEGDDAFDSEAARLDIGKEEMAAENAQEDEAEESREGQEGSEKEEGKESRGKESQEEALLGSELRRARKRLNRADTFVKRILDRGDGEVRMQRVLKAVIAFKSSLDKGPVKAQESGQDEELDAWYSKAKAILKNPEEDRPDDSVEKGKDDPSGKSSDADKKAADDKMKEQVEHFVAQQRAMNTEETILETESLQLEGEELLVKYEKKLFEVEESQNNLGSGHAVVGEPTDVVVQFGFSHTMWPGDRVMLGLPSFQGCEHGRVKTSGRDSDVFGEARWFASGMLTLFFTGKVSLPAKQDVFVSVPGVVLLPKQGVSREICKCLTISAISGPEKLKTAQHALPSLLIHPTDGPYAEQPSCFRKDFDSWPAPEPEEGLPMHRQLKCVNGNRGMGIGENWYSFDGKASEILSRACPGVRVRMDHRAVAISSQGGKHTLYTENMAGSERERESASSHRRVGFQAGFDDDDDDGDDDDHDASLNLSEEGMKEDADQVRKRLSTRQARRRWRKAGEFDVVLVCTPAPEAAALLGGVAPGMARVAASVKQTGCWVGWAVIWPGLPCKYDAITLHADPEKMLVWASRSVDHHRNSSSRPRTQSRNIHSRSALRSSLSSRHQVAATPGQREREQARMRGGEDEDGELWIMYGTPTWKAGVEVQEGDEGSLALQMLDHLKMLLGLEDDQDVRAAGERWRTGAALGDPSHEGSLLHSTPEAACSAGNSLAVQARSGLGLTGLDGCLFDPARGLGIAGDWLVDASVEGAFLSGCALADRVAESHATCTVPNYFQDPAGPEISGLTHDDKWSKGPFGALDADPTVSLHYWNGRPARSSR